MRRRRPSPWARALFEASAGPPGWPGRRDSKRFRGGRRCNPAPPRRALAADNCREFAARTGEALAAPDGPERVLAAIAFLHGLAQLLRSGSESRRACSTRAVSRFTQRVVEIGVQLFAGDVAHVRSRARVDDGNSSDITPSRPPSVNRLHRSFFSGITGASFRASFAESLPVRVTTASLRSMPTP